MVRLVEVARDRSSGEFFVRGAEGIVYYRRKKERDYTLFPSALVDHFPRQTWTQVGKVLMSEKL